MTAPTGTHFLAEVLASGFCDAQVQRQIGRVLIASSGADFRSPVVQGDEDALMESLVRVDEAWTRVRRTWTRVAESGSALAEERSAAKYSPHEDRTARREALRSLPSEGNLRDARAEFAEALSGLAAAYEG